MADRTKRRRRCRNETSSERGSVPFRVHIDTRQGIVEDFWTIARVYPGASHFHYRYGRSAAYRRSWCSVNVDDEIRGGDDTTWTRAQRTCVCPYAYEGRKRKREGVAVHGRHWPLSARGRMMTPGTLSGPGTHSTYSIIVVGLITSITLIIGLPARPDRARSLASHVHHRTGKAPAEHLL